MWSSYTFYDPSGHTSAQSISYFVAAYTGAAGSAAFSIPDSTIATSTMGYDGLGRTLSTTDAISDTTSLAYLVACGVVTGDSGCYEETQATDANSHRRASFTNGLGYTAYAQTFTGNSSLHPLCHDGEHV